MPQFGRFISTLCSLILLTGCSSVSVDKVTPVDVAPQAPKKIYVQNFEVPSEIFRVDRSGKSLIAFRESFDEQLTRAIVVRATKRLAPAEVLATDAKIPRESAWLVTGRFLTVNQGSRALRAAIGFGFGGTKVETVVTVSDLSGRKPRPFLKFVTSGGTNAPPGAAIGMIVPNYYLIALDVVGKGLPGLSADVIRTSREVVAVLSEYMAQEGYLPHAKVSRAKKLGQWP